MTVDDLCALYIAGVLVSFLLIGFLAPPDRDRWFPGAMMWPLVLFVALVLYVPIWISSAGHWVRRRVWDLYEEDNP